MANSTYRTSEHRKLVVDDAPSHLEGLTASLVKRAAAFLALGMSLAGCASSPMDGAGISIAPAPGGQPVAMEQAGAAALQCTATAANFEPPAANASVSPLGQNPDRPMRMIAASCWSDQRDPIAIPEASPPYRGALIALNSTGSK